jgi:predicted RNA-binding Zn ribbon-like protein
MSDVQLTISKEAVTAIVEAKIKEAILSALGGSEKIIAAIIDTVLLKKVDAQGKVSNYQNDNKFSWMDIVITKTIQQEAEAAVREHIAQSAVQIRQAIIKHLETKKGRDMVAKALLDSMNGTFVNSWRSQIKIDLMPLPSED